MTADAKLCDQVRQRLLRNDYLPLSAVRDRLGIRPADVPSGARIDRSFDATFRPSIFGWLCGMFGR